MKIVYHFKEVNDGIIILSAEFRGVSVNTREHVVKGRKDGQVPFNIAMVDIDDLQESGKSFHTNLRRYLSVITESTSVAESKEELYCP